MNAKLNQKNNNIRINFNTLLFKYIIFFSFIKQYISSSCNYTHPIKKNNICIEGDCTTEEFLSGICKIENDITKTQNLTSIIKFSGEGYDYTMITTTPNGDLVAGSTIYKTTPITLKYYYGLRKNGRPYFLNNNKETPFMTTDSDKYRYEGNLFAIKINGTNNDKEYIIGFGNGGANFEIYDFEDNNYNLYKQVGSTFFGTSYNYFQIAAIFKLKTKDDYYIIGIMAETKPLSEKKFILMKLIFNSIDIVNNLPIIKKEILPSVRELITSCFETDNNFIICFYRDDADHYVLVVYDQELNFQKSENIVSTSNDLGVFFKCVHFEGESGAFLYYGIDGIYIKFKKYDNGNIIDYFNTIPQVKINNDNFRTEIKFNDMNKLGVLKFCFINISTNKKVLNIIIINSYHDEKIKVRYYKYRTYSINLYTFTQQLKASLYNGLIALASNGKIGTNSQYGNLIIFSYPNSSDFMIDITDNITSFTNPIIKLYEKCNIENNLFGYVFEGIKIYNYTFGLKLLNESNKIEILTDEIISNFTNIELVLTKDINIREIGRIEFSMVLTEPEYEIYNKYPESIDNSYCGNDDNEERDYFGKNHYYGRISYCNININSNIVIKDCNENCEICINNDELTCVICKYLQEISDDGKKTCLNKDETPQKNTETEIITNQNNLKTIITDIKLSTEVTNIPNEESFLTNEISTIYSEITTKIKESLKAETEISTKQNEEILLTNEVTTIYNEIPIISSEIKTKEIEISTKQNEETLLTNKITINNEIPLITSESTTILSEKILINNCSNIDIINNKCTDEITIEQMENIKSNILNKTYTNNNIIVKTKNIIVQLSTLEVQKNIENPEVSNIDLGECENKLKRENKIPKEESLIIYKADIKTEDLSNIYVLYEVYNPENLVKLDLEVCKDDKISINVPVNIDPEIKTLYDSLNQSGYNIFDKNDSFYNDICATYTSINGTDMLLSDRKKDIYSTSKSQVMCQNGCELKSYDSTTKKAKCDCSINTKMETNLNDLFKKEEIEKNFYETITKSNFKVLKCYKLIFNLSRIKKNIGEILMSLIFIIFLILMIIFCCLSRRRINNYIKFVLQIKTTKTFKNIRKSAPLIKNVEKNSLKLKIKKSLKNNKLDKLDESKLAKLVEENEKKTFNKEKTKRKLKKNKKSSPPKRRKKKFYSHSVKKNSNTGRTSIDKIINNNNNILLNVKLINSKVGKRKSNTYKIKNNNDILKRKSKQYKSAIFAPKRISIISNSNLNKKKSFLLKNSSKSSINWKNNESNFNKQDYRCLNDQEMNSLKYELAIELDKRTYIQYYWSLLKQKQLILFTFYLQNDYNLTTIKISLFLISFSLYFTINGFFFSDETMHKVYTNKGKYDIILKIPKILYSTIVSAVINTILKILSLSEKNILEIKEEKNISLAMKKSKEILLILKIKFLIFFISGFFFMAFFWYFISCFCAVFINTQIILMKDTFFSFILSMIYPFGLNLLPGMFRIPSLRSKNKNKTCLYNFSKILAFI